MRKSRLFMSAAAACLAGTMAVTGFAATEHWNDNSGKKAISDEWSQWKTKWETIKTDYEKVSMVPGADATKLNYAGIQRKQMKQRFASQQMLICQKQQKQMEVMHIQKIIKSLQEHLKNTKKLMM